VTIDGKLGRFVSALYLYRNHNHKRRIDRNQVSGFQLIDIPETIPNPVVIPKPTPTPIEPAPKAPVRIPEKVPGTAGVPCSAGPVPALVSDRATEKPTTEGRSGICGVSCWRLSDSCNPKREFPS
jgi:hypothetical protein